MNRVRCRNRRPDSTGVIVLGIPALSVQQDCAIVPDCGLCDGEQAWSIGTVAFWSDHGGLGKPSPS